MIKTCVAIVGAIGFSGIGFGVTLLLMHPGESRSMALGAIAAGYCVTALAWWLTGRLSVKKAEPGTAEEGSEDDG